MATTETVHDPFLGMLKQGTHSGADVLMTLGIALIVLGAIALVSPLTSGVLFDLLFGAVLIGAGIVEFSDAFRSDTWQRGVLLALSGIVTLAAGLLFVARPLVGLLALTLAFIAYLMFVGVFRLVMAIQLPKGTQGKAVSFVSGLVAIALAFVSIRGMPGISPWLIGTYIGVSLVLAGVSRISVALGLRKAEHMLVPAHGGAHA